MYGQEQNTREQILEQYTPDVKKLTAYLPWLQKVRGEDAASTYEGEGKDKETLLSIPVFDSTLLAFVKEAEKTQFVNKNYPYVYTRYHINSHEMERMILREAKINEMDKFMGIISKYVLEGKYKPVAWKEAISERIFQTALEALSELFFKYTADPKEPR